MKKLSDKQKLRAQLKKAQDEFVVAIEKEMDASDDAARAWNKLETIKLKITKERL